MPLIAPFYSATLSSRRFGYVCASPQDLEKWKGGAQWLGL